MAVSDSICNEKGLVLQLTSFIMMPKVHKNDKNHHIMQKKYFQMCDFLLPQHSIYTKRMRKRLGLFAMVTAVILCRNTFSPLWGEFIYYYLCYLFIIRSGKSCVKCLKLPRTEQLCGGCAWVLIKTGINIADELNHRPLQA